jgi:membrane protein DedA with SNARE-associated domain
VTSFLAHHGLWAVFVLMAIDAVFPAASELVMLYGGALASGALTHQLDVLGTPRTGLGAYLAIAIAGTIGYTLGGIAGWAIGFYGGRPLLERHGRWLHLGPERLERAERWFGRWGDWTVLIGRILPVVRSFVSIPAGVLEMRFWRYVVLTLIGSAIWCFVLAGAGWGLGASWSHAHHDFRYVEVLVALVVVAIAAYVIVRWRRSTTIPDRAPDSPR